MNGINVKAEFIILYYTLVIDSHVKISKTAKIGTANLVVEHIVTTPTCSTTKSVNVICDGPWQSQGVYQV